MARPKFSARTGNGLSALPLPAQRRGLKLLRYIKGPRQGRGLHISPSGYLAAK
jgi:hypothetical protein